jgi:uncharacterized protein (DUF952 family)
MSGTQTKRQTKSSIKYQFQWSKTEECRFLLALELFGGDYCQSLPEIAAFIGSRTENQVRSFGQKLFDHVSLLYKIWLGTATTREVLRVESSSRRLLPDVLQGTPFEDVLRAERLQKELETANLPPINTLEYTEAMIRATETCEKLLSAYRHRKDVEFKQEDYTYLQFQQYLAQTCAEERASKDFVSPCGAGARRMLLLSETGQSTLAKASDRIMAGVLRSKAKPKKRASLTSLYQEKRKKHRLEEKVAEPALSAPTPLAPADPIIDAKLEEKWLQFRRTLLMSTETGEQSMQMDMVAASTVV